MAGGGGPCGVLAGVGMVVLFAGSGGGEVTSGLPATTAGPTATASPATAAASIPEDAALSEEDALAVANAYFTAYAAADIDGMLGLLADDVAIPWNYGATPNETVDDLHTAIVWDVAQQAVITDLECEALPQGSATAAGAAVDCTFGVHQYLARAVAAPPAYPQTWSVELSPDGLIEVIELDGDTNGFFAVNFHFNSWMQANHPEDAETAACCEGETVEESISRGEARVFYADLWAAYLEENGCVWNEPCEP